jgi:3-hexulose-6-phosphate synthase
MKLQVALDLTDRKKALRIAEAVADYADIIEAGTPLIKAAGMSIVSELKKFSREVLADTKTMDAAAVEAEEAKRAGADYFTVLAVAPENTKKEALQVSGIKKVIDLIGVKDKVPVAKKYAELFDLTVLHTGIDEGYFSPEGLEPLRRLKGLSVAGGINLNNVERIVETLEPEVVIVGRAITGAKDPKAAAKAFKEVLE